MDKKYTEEYVNINGIEHYLLHYQGDKKGPVVLFIHGGPGQSESMFANHIEEQQNRKYTTVYYDQRGTGKTYCKNKKALPTIEGLKSDLLQVVLYLCKKYNKKKLILLGHSWGTVLGSMFALEYPEYVQCYIGTGQVVNIIRNEETGYRKLCEAITRSGNRKDKKLLNAIGTYPDKEYSPEFMKKLIRVRKLQGKYNLSMRIDKTMIRTAWKSPVFSLKDLYAMMRANKINSSLMAYLFEFDLARSGTKYQVPVYYLLGERDNQTPSELAVEYLNTIEAPVKELKIIPNAGHMAYLDNLMEYRKLLNDIIEKQNA